MTQLFAVLLLIIVGPSAAFASQLDCSSADAYIRFKAGRYEGGAPPPPEMRLTWADLTRDGTTFQDVAHQLTDQRVLAIKQSAFQITKTFSAIFTADLPAGEKVKALVICRSIEHTGPPRP